MNESEAISRQKEARQCRNQDRLQKIYKEDSSVANLLAQQTEKCNETSNKFRLEGHSHFLSHHYVNAIDAYNQSLCHAEITGDKFHLSMTFGHRAEAYFKMRMFVESKQSIQLALASSYPDELKTRMEALQRKCDDEISKETKAVLDYTVKLTHTANEQIPNVIADLKLQKTEKSGRHIITERDLAVGDVIAMEDAYLTQLNPKDRYKRCAFCLSDRRHALFPCSFCTNVMFCSQKCEKDSWTVFHRYECPISDYLLTIEPGARMAIKALLLGLSIFKDFQAMKQFLEKEKSRDLTVFDGDFKVENDRDRFLVFCGLFKDDDHFGNRVRMANMRRSSEILHILRSQSDLSEKIDSQEMEHFLLDFLYSSICIHLNNGFELGKSLPNSSLASGAGIFPVFSLANHSCAPNVMRISKNSRQYWIVSRRIKKGTQIFDNYGMCFLNEDLATRQRKCLQLYGFLCKCEACVKDLPKIEEMEASKEVPNEVLQETIADYQDPKALLQQLDKVAAFMQKFDDHYPCRQLVEADNILWHIYRRILDDTMLEVKLVQFYDSKEKAK